MSEEIITKVDDKCCLDDAKPMEFVEAMSVIKEEVVRGDDSLLPAAVSNEINHVNPRRYSTGSLDKRGLSKAQVQTRYRGNQLSSTHDLCKHGKRREDDLVIKPWKLVKNKNVEVKGGDLVKGETLSLMRKSLGNVSKLKKPLEVPKRDIAASETVKSCDGLGIKTGEIKSGAAVVREVKKTNLDVKKVSRINENKSSKEDLLKNLKNKEKKKIEEDVLEKTLYVVESSIEEKGTKKKKIIKSVKPETQKSSEKTILRGTGKKSLIPSLSTPSEEVKEPHVTRSDPRPIRQTTSRSKTSLPEKKEIGSANLVTKSKTESKIRPKKIGLKTTPPPPPSTAKPVSFKKGKVLELKQEDSAPKLIKFKKRVIQEPKLRSYGTKKNLKEKREVAVKMSNNNGEGKREKVVLRHRKVEEKKKLQTLFNNVIEETVNKLEDVRKSKVQALVGAFETVISLQDNDLTSQKKKIQRKSTSAVAVDG